MLNSKVRTNSSIKYYHEQITFADEVIILLQEVRRKYFDDMEEYTTKHYILNSTVVQIVKDTSLSHINPRLLTPTICSEGADFCSIDAFLKQIAPDKLTSCSKLEKIYFSTIYYLLDEYQREYRKEAR